jgi:hypothetical protein
MVPLRLLHLGNCKYSNAHRCPTRANQRPRSVPLRDAHEDCRVRERHEPGRRRRPEHACSCAYGRRLDQRASVERLVRPLGHRPVEFAPRPFLLCGVGHHTSVQLSACLFHGGVAQLVHAARQSDALLARLFAVRRLVAVRAHHVRLTADRGNGRRHDRTCAAAIQRQRRTSKRFASRRKRLWHQPRLAHHTQRRTLSGTGFSLFGLRFQGPQKIPSTG